MSIENVKEYFKKFKKDNEILEFETSSATVELAAKALSCQPARICKTLSFIVNNECILICTAGDVKIDNKKFKQTFNCKAKMLTFDEVFEYTSHNVGGVCPFGIERKDVKTYCDISLNRFNTVYPACGSSNSAIELSPQDLFNYSNSCGWVDVTY